MQAASAACGGRCGLGIHAGAYTLHSAGISSSTKLGMPMDALSLFQVFPFGSTCAAQPPLTDYCTAEQAEAKVNGTCSRLVCVHKIRQARTRWECTLMDVEWLSRLRTYLSGCLDDNWNGQIDIVGVDKAHCAPGVASKCGVHRIVRQHLHQQQQLLQFLRPCFWLCTGL